MASLGAAFGLAVRFTRQRRRWSQEQLAKLAKLDRAYLGRIERGVIEPGFAIQERLAAALGVSLAELVADAERERERWQANQERPPRPRSKAANTTAGPAPASTAPIKQGSETRPSIAAAIIVEDGRVLMTRRRFAEGSLSWAFPAGECEEGESPEPAVEREVHEEVGLEVQAMRRLGERVHPATGRHMVYLACRVIAGSVDLVDHEELAELAWCDLAGLAERVPNGVFEPVQEYLEGVLAPVASEGG